MKTAPLQVIAVVVTYNRPQELRQVLLALLAQRRPPEQIIILDNASSPPAALMVADLSGFQVVRSEVNTGGAGGFALGLAEALQRQADWVWLMDDDAVPHEDALWQLLKALPDLPETTGVVCSSVYEYGVLALQHRRTFSRLLGIERAIPERCYQYTAIAADTASFVGFLVSAQAVQNVGLPDTRFFLAYDDTEYSLRLKNAGWQIWLIPASQFEHWRTATSRLRSSGFGAKHYYNIRNRIAVAVRYGGLPILAASVATLVGVMLWLVCSRLKHPGSLALLIRAVSDGWRRRLGVFDDTGQS